MADTTEHNAEDLFRNAVGFSFSAQLLSLHGNLRMKWRKPAFDDIGADCPTLQSGVVLSAFSLELYLKCLIILTGGKYPRKHTLIELFELLPEIIRTDVVAEFDRLMIAAPSAIRPDNAPDGNRLPSDHYSFQNCLSVMNNAFRNWRYLHESTGVESIEYYGHGPFTLSLERRIVAIRPGWAKWIGRASPLPSSIGEFDPHGKFIETKDDSF